LYGATKGKAFFNGRAGERFAVRNSGAAAVVEGVGDHGCEYMTRGLVVVLGQTGRNFAAGMSGGVAYVFDQDGTFGTRCNMGQVEIDPLEVRDLDMLHDLVKRHFDYTQSAAAWRILSGWKQLSRHFAKVMPVEYRSIVAKLHLDAEAEKLASV